MSLFFVMSLDLRHTGYTSFSSCPLAHNPTGQAVNCQLEAMKFLGFQIDAILLIIISGISKFCLPFNLMGTIKQRSDLH